MAKKAKKLSHFYPLALSTYHILPPPNQVEKNMGKKGKLLLPYTLHFGEEIDLDAIVASIGDKQEKRKARAEIISELIMTAYRQFGDQ